MTTKTPSEKATIDKGAVPSAEDAVTVTLKKPHRHAGKMVAAGDKLTIAARQLERLKKAGKV